MTDEDIISVLEKITKIESKDDAKNDTIYFMKGIFDLIKRQQAEIEKYKDLEEQGRLIVIELDNYKRDDQDRCTHRYCNKCDNYRRELQKYKDLEKQDRLIELPCKVGDTIWRIATQHNNYDDSPYKIVMKLSFRLDYLKEMGKTVFLTKEEAEAKLEEMVGANNDR